MEESPFTSNSRDDEMKSDQPESPDKKMEEAGPSLTPVMVETPGQLVRIVTQVTDPKFSINTTPGQHKFNSCATSVPWQCNINTNTITFQNHTKARTTAAVFFYITSIVQHKSNTCAVPCMPYNTSAILQHIELPHIGCWSSDGLKLANSFSSFTAREKSL